MQPCHDLGDAVSEADYVVEAVLEDLPLKQKLFAEIEQKVRPDTILASNTSVIPITRIMEGLKDRSRALGTHWWNPPFLVPLVEVIGTQWTSQHAIDWTIALHKAAGKMPVHVKKDVPGFVGNRLQHALWREAIALVEHGICDAETVDTVIKASFGRRLAVLGPLENADLVGTDLTLAIHKTVLPAIESRPGPVALSRKARVGGAARLQIGRRLSRMEHGGSGRAARKGLAASEKGSRAGLKAAHSCNRYSTFDLAIVLRCGSNMGRLRQTASWERAPWHGEQAKSFLTSRTLLI